MKTLFTCSLLCCLILATSAGYAQKNARTTSPTHNLVAVANCTSDGASYTLTDSTTYSYSHNRTGGAYLTLIGWDYAGAYDTAIKYVYGTGMYTPGTRSVQLFDASGNMLSQTTQKYSDTAASHWLNEWKYEYTYDARNNMLSKAYAYWTVPYMATVATWVYGMMDGYTYDTSNNLLTDTLFSADTTAWIAGSANQFSYDAHHNITKEISTDKYPSWDTFRVINYWLNAGFKPDSTTTFNKRAGVWSLYSIEKYTYDASYNMLSDTLANVVYSKVTPWQLTINTYTGGNLATQESRTNKGDTLPVVWTNVNYKMMSYDAASNMISVINQNWNPSPSFLSYVNANNDTNTFSSFNKITNYTTTSWEITKKQWIQTPGHDAQARFYYDTIPGLYVNNAIKEATSISMYPVPANNNLKVSVNRNGSHNIVFDVFDMKGGLYRQWSVNMTDSYSTDIPTAMLPAGNYILTAKSEGETIAKQFSVVH